MTVNILVGNCMDVLPTLADKSVHCCVTSPPYWGLRDYGLEPSVWGGAADCEHDWSASGEQDHTGQFCSLCEAWRGQLGLEPTPDLYVEHLVAVFREVHRVLRDDGTLWLNLGDSYAGLWGAQGRNGSMADRSITSARQIEQHPCRKSGTGSVKNTPGLKAKDLIGTPWMTALALRADGWYLRQEIIWNKPNPMPESVTDRCTKAHEHLFLLAKSSRYYYDAAAIAEPLADSSIARLQQDTGAQKGSDRVPFKTNGPMKAVLRKSGNKERKSAVARGVPLDSDGRPIAGGDVAGSIPWEGSTRNKRSVWTVVTQPFSEAHFATFPPELIEPCVLAGSPEGGTVLDPFGGAGTTGLVCDRHHRGAMLIELNTEYAEMARGRLQRESPLFSDVRMDNGEEAQEAEGLRTPGLPAGTS